MLRSFFFLLTGVAALAQTVEGPVFEVASVKFVENPKRLVVGIQGGPGTESPLRITAPTAHLAWLMQEAFALPSYRFASTERIPERYYEISATLPEGATKEQSRKMLVNLLIERFHFRYHMETRNVPVQELRVADGGPKLKASTTTPVPGSGGRPSVGADGYLVFAPGINSPGPAYGNGPRFSVQRVAVTMEEFAHDVMEGWLRQPVVNATGLSGKYDIYLRFNAANANPASLNPNDPASFEPPFAPALKEQLGLVLKEAKAPMEVIVIDSIDRDPTAN